MSQPDSPNPNPTRRPRWPTLVALLLTALICFPTLNRFNPRYSLLRLRGLSSEQVIARLGAPDYDTRRNPDQPYNDPTANFTIGYLAPLGVIHELSFEHDRLIDVEHWSK